MAKTQELIGCAVILAGGRGTRFWPRSRKRTPKQLLNIVSGKSMLRETADRLAPILPAAQMWVVTNEEQAQAVRHELRRVPHAQILSEPVGRNTAAAIGLAAIHLEHKHGDALMAVLPADHYIGKLARYRRIVRAAMEQANTPGNLVVLGIPPTRPDTGFGYIERSKALRHGGRMQAFAVKRFTEKPNLAQARKYLESRRYFWNAGMFFWRVSTFLECLKNFLPRTWEALQELKETIGTRAYPLALRKAYRRLQAISVDYAIMEPATRRGAKERVLVLPANVGWSDIGSWAAVYERLDRDRNQNVLTANSLVLDGKGNFVSCRGKFAAVVGVNSLVIVDTHDALLVCSRERSQDVSKVVKWLEENRRSDLL